MTTFATPYRPVILPWVMGILGTALFLLIFLALTPAAREFIGQGLSGAGDWIAKWAPYSYMVLVLILVLPVIAAIVVMKWPQPPPPEDPLARFKHEDVLD